jgi:hypothetical protein
VGGLSILWDPRPAFLAVRDDPHRKWLVPLILFVLVSAAATTFHFMRMDVSAQLLEQMAANLPEGQEDALDKMEGMVSAIAAFTMAAAYIGPGIYLLGLGFVVWLMAKIFGGAGSFSQAVSVAVLSQFPQMYAAVLGVIASAFRSTPPGLQELQALLSVHPAAFSSLEATDPLYLLSASFGLFGIWSLALAIAGTSIVFGIKPSKSALGWCLLKVATTVMAVGGAAMGAAAQGMS